MAYVVALCLVAVAWVVGHTYILRWWRRVLAWLVTVAPRLPAEERRETQRWFARAVAGRYAALVAAACEVLAALALLWEGVPVAPVIATMVVAPIGTFAVEYAYFLHVAQSRMS